MKKKASRKRRRSREMVANGWLKQAGWLVKTITELHESPTGHGLKWTGKMVAHYYAQFQAMRMKTPKVCTHQAEVYDEELLSIIDKYTDFL